MPNRLYDDDAIADNPYKLPVDIPAFETKPREPLRFTVHPKDNMTAGPPTGAADTSSAPAYSLQPVDYDPFQQASMTHGEDKRKKLSEIFDQSSLAGKTAIGIAGLPYGLIKSLVVDPIESAADLTHQSQQGDFVSNDPNNVGKASSAAALGGTGGLAGAGEGGVALGRTLTKAEFDEVMRQHRALKQGFDTDSFHGTPLSFRGDAVQTFDSKKSPELQGQFYSADKPNLANQYTLSHISDTKLREYGIDPNNYNKQVLPLRLDTTEYHEFDAKGKNWNEVNQKAIREAKNKGMKGVTVKNVIDNLDDTINGEPATIHITFDPSTVRSRFAKFSPQNVGKSGLMLSDTTIPGAAIGSLSKAPMFYSAVEHAVNNIKQAKAPAEQWLATIQNSKGVKPEELDWTGLKSYGGMMFHPVDGDPFEKKK